ncbi:hypothetical protein Dda_4983 [Drechslerella dactyloides]|uniref:Uncharacterized protein n=1 Tax=Drechslerella dactyloides TaxID=74499 RepID=A0AAD6NJJ2_DREDA|nr:hypothetical protein Dda_4983 [Drechslerella dactyloides]
MQDPQSGSSVETESGSKTMTYEAGMALHAISPGKSIKRSVTLSLLPWQVDSDAMKDFLEIKLPPNPTVLEMEHASQWRKSKVAELGVVNVVGALVAAVVGSAFTWPATTDAPWTVLATFYGSLILSLVAIATGSQQSIALYRLGESQSALEKLQKLLRSKKDPSKLSSAQRYLWQVPVMLLNVSVLVFLVGLMILIWERAAVMPSWDDDMKVAFVASLAGIFGLANYVLGMFLLYQGNGNAQARGSGGNQAQKGGSAQAIAAV